MSSTKEAAQARATPAEKSEWAPRMWLGCNFWAWWRLLARGRFWVHWPYWHILVSDTFVCLFNSVMGWVQLLTLGWRIRRTKIEQPPVFILGHSRTGTTLLHELLSLDDRHGSPTTYQCMSPSHFVLTQAWLPTLVPFLFPSQRPMDNMKISPSSPQEDEFALCMLGLPSPYLTVAFPNQPPKCQEYLSLENVPPRARARWQRTLFRFLQAVTYSCGRRLVLKSPPHTARIKVLRELFPDAVFIHILRDPYVVYPSTVNLWKTLYRKQGLQTPTFAGLEDHVFETGLRLYDKLEESRSLVEPGRFYELRYEDLIADPVGQMRLLYEHLRLGAFDKVSPKLEEYVARRSDYRTNKYKLTPELEDEISRRWGPLIERYGYARDANGRAANSA